MKVVFTQVDHKNIVTIDGTSYTYRELGRFLNLSPQTVHSAFWNKSEDERVTWIKKKQWLHKQGMSMKVALYTDGKEFYSLAQIQRASGLTTATASVRGRDWEAGKLTKKGMLRKKTNCGPKVKREKPLWGNLKSVVRNHNLKGIPDPTKFDHEVVGQSVGMCLPSNSNSGSHRRY